MTLAERNRNPVAAGLMKRLLTEPEMEQAKGGYWIVDGGCLHYWVRTGRSKEESYFIFWTHTVYEETCSRCGKTRWD